MSDDTSGSEEEMFVISYKAVAVGQPWSHALVTSSESFSTS